MVLISIVVNLLLSVQIETLYLILKYQISNYSQYVAALQLKYSKIALSFICCIKFLPYLFF